MKDCDKRHVCDMEFGRIRADIPNVSQAPTSVVKKTMEEIDSSNGKASNSVVAGTYVNTEYGIVPVESIKPGTAIEAMFGAQSDGSVYLPVKSIQEREFRVTIGDRKRKFKTLAQARKWITRALCGRK